MQVSEVYSSGAWLGLQLPDGGESAPRRVWALPPRASRPLVRLRLTPPRADLPAHHHPLTAYIRIKVRSHPALPATELDAVRRDALSMLLANKSSLKLHSIYFD